MDLKSLIRKKAESAPPRILIYTTPGWGKTTTAASMPNAIFIDAEDGMMGLDVDSFPTVTDYDEIETYIRALIEQDHGYKTLVLDTMSSIEKLIWAKVCKDHNKPSIESFGYAKGYVHAMTYWEKILGGLEILRKKGVAPVLLAHSEVKVFNSPIVDAYDKYILKLHRHPANRLTEWCDLILFGDHKVVVKKEGEGFNKTSKGIGQGQRVLYTEERPAFLAKSRMELPFEIEVSKADGWAAVAQHLDSKNNKINATKQETTNE